MYTRKYYNIEDLAKHLKHFEITVSDIEHLLEVGKLVAEFKDSGEPVLRPGNSLYYIRDLIRLVPNDYKKSIYISDDSYLFGEIIISSEEVSKFEKFLQGDTNQISNTDSDSANQDNDKDKQSLLADKKLYEFNLDDYVAQKRDKKGCESDSCFKCKEDSCRSQLVHELVTSYGYHTQYRKSLCNIGVALGCIEPTWAGKENKEQMRRQKKEVSAIKAQVKRWLQKHTC